MARGKVSCEFKCHCSAVLVLSIQKAMQCLPLVQRETGLEKLFIFIYQTDFPLLLLHNEQCP